jgi:archaellum component FlaC
MDYTLLITSITGAIASVATGATALWKWIDKPLIECKQEHKASRERIEELHNEIKDVSISVGELRGQVTVYQNAFAKWLPHSTRSSNSVDGTSESV